MVMVMMNCFCGINDRRKAFSLIYNRHNCQRSQTRPKFIRIIFGKLKTDLKKLDPFQRSLASHLETNCLDYIANQMTGFYMERNTGLKWVKYKLFINKVMLSF